MSVVHLVVLGASSAITSAEADNTYLALRGLGPPLLIDCGGSPPHKLLRAGIDPRDLAGVLLTHDHADHLYGLPVLAQYLRMLHRDRPLILYGLEPTLETARALLIAVRSLYDLIEFRTLPAEEKVPVIQTEQGVLYTSPVRHSRPTLGVRIEAEGRVLAYSCDTEPCPALVRLAQGADLLLHECTVDRPARGHSTPEDAAHTAANAGAGQLVLIHYDPWLPRRFEEVRARIAKIYAGPVSLARQGDVYPLHERTRGDDD